MSSEMITRNDNCVVSIALGKYKMLLSLELVRIRSANGRIRITQWFRRLGGIMDPSLAKISTYKDSSGNFYLACITLRKVD